MDNYTMSAEEEDQLLTELNDKRAVAMIPVIVFLVTLMMLGLVGNLLVFYYYGCKTRRTSNSVFICAVAVYDLISCCLSIPIEIVDLRFFYVFHDSGACKFLRFVNHFAAIGSAFTLLVIAGDRYNRICRPFRKQLTLQNSKLACGTSVIFSLFFSWPAFLFYSSVSVEVETASGTPVIGSDCTTLREESYKGYIWFYNGVHFLLFMTSVIILCVMYSLVGRELLRHKQMRQPYKNATPSSSNTMINSTRIRNDAAFNDAMNEAINNTACSTSSDDISSSEASKSDSENATKATTVKSQRTATQSNNSSGSKSTSHNKELDIKTIKYTLIMLVITIVFIVSFLPYLILVIWRAFLGQHEANVLSNSGLVAFQVGIRSYFLNAAVNPMTYGFFNSHFRLFFFKTVCFCGRARFEKTTLSTSSVTG